MKLKKLFAMGASVLLCCGAMSAAAVNASAETYDYETIVGDPVPDPYSTTPADYADLDKLPEIRFDLIDERASESGSDSDIVLYDNTSSAASVTVPNPSTGTAVPYGIVTLATLSGTCIAALSKGRSRK